MYSALSTRLIKKIMLVFTLLILLVGVGYVMITFYFTNKFFEEASQKLNARVADHLIEEKFQESSPYLEDGSVNKAFFGDVMHDMMAVNRGIEVYLLNEHGEILYSVVLDHSDDDKPRERIDLGPVNKFIASEGDRYILGDDPRNPESQKIFSAAAFEVDGKKGFIYIILAGQQFEQVTSSLTGSYFLRLGLGASIATVVFAGLIGLLAIWFLTKNLREIIDTVRRFRDGDLMARIENPKNKDLSILTETYNSMANTIVANIEELKSVESLRRELMANVSHDLRTPLAVTQGYIETLQIKSEQLSKEEQNHYLNIIQKNIGKLANLIDQLFEYTKLEAKQIEPQKESFPISDLAYDVFEKYQQLATVKKITINLDIEKNLPLVFADISLVERVIQNLMDNALKFTPEGGDVTIEMKSDKRYVFVSIKDTGIGIKKEELTKIFERYKQSTTSKKVEREGAGLGLAIAKKIMEIHDSTIKVVSQPDRGTTFQFQLPVFS